VYTEEYRPSYAYRAMMGTIAGSVNYEFFVGAGTYLVNWFKKHQNLGDTEGKSPEQYWNDRAAEVPIGSQGLFTLPYWNGALTPYWDQNARGAVVGYSGIHGNEHLFRSILEGIAFELRVCLDSASATLREPLSCLITMGGGARSPLWCQMLADILRIPISIAKSEESTALGAGMLAFAAVGAYPDARAAAKAMSGRGHTYEPNLENALEYDKYFEIYRSLYPALKPVFESLAEVS
jgi:xylulokinase